MTMVIHDPIAFRLASLTPSPNTLLRMHWARRRALAIDLAWQIRAAIRGPLPAVPFERARIVVRRHAVQALDADNLVGSLKLLLDCLQPASARHPHGLGMIRDDSSDRLTIEAAHVRAAKRCDQFTAVEVWPA